MLLKLSSLSIKHELVGVLDLFGTGSLEKSCGPHFFILLSFKLELLPDEHSLTV